MNNFFQGLIVAATPSAAFDPGKTRQSVFSSEIFGMVQTAFYALGVVLALVYSYKLFKGLITANEPGKVVKEALWGALLVAFCFNLQLPIFAFDIAASAFQKIIDSISGILPT